MSDEYKGADLLAIEEKLEAAFNYACEYNAGSRRPYEEEIGFGRSAAETADSIVNLRRQRIAEQQGGKVDKLKMG